MLTRLRWKYVCDNVKQGGTPGNYYDLNRSQITNEKLCKSEGRGEFMLTNKAGKVSVRYWAARYEISGSCPSITSILPAFICRQAQGIIANIQIMIPEIKSNDVKVQHIVSAITYQNGRKTRQWNLFHIEHLSYRTSFISNLFHI